MAEVRRVFVCVLSVICFINNVVAGYTIPPLTIQAFTPKGFRAFIPDSTGVSLFAFQGNINRPIDSNQAGMISGEVTKASDGRWVVDLPDIRLEIGDTINYHLFVAVDRAGYVRDNQNFQVQFLEEYVALPTTAPGRPAPPPGSACLPTRTLLRTGTACAGQTVFEENFDSLRDALWQVEQYIPVEHPEIPFVSYQKTAVSVQDGILHITPELLQSQKNWTDDDFLGGSLNLLQGCTQTSASACAKTVEGANILPPIVSGRVTSRPGFAFTYGTISVRAKLPQGDWLYPEILLEPFEKKYGFGPLKYESGILKIASARGNKVLTRGSSTYGNKLLYGGPAIQALCRDALFSENLSQNFWGDDYHVYSLKWTPERITLFVDDVQWGSAEPTAYGLRGGLAISCRSEDQPDQPGLTPFNDHFYITLGLAAGGVTEFRDGYQTTGNHAKPWMNLASKAMLTFWEDRAAWHATWQRPELLVDYVKVVAL